jgi:hypothetical protein
MDVDERLRAGMNATGEFLVEEKQSVLTVPGDAVKDVGDDTEVTVIRDPKKPLSDEANQAARKAEVGHVHHVRMTKASGGTSFPAKALDELLMSHEFGRDDLERDGSFRSEMRGEKDCAHTALAQLPLDTIFLVQNFADQMREFHENLLLQIEEIA